MAKKSKTDVASRQENKARKAICKYCGSEKVETCMTLVAGKKRIIRKCCEKAGLAKVGGKYV